MTEPEAQTFTVGEGDDLITYDVRGDLASAASPLFMFGSPMEASYFGTLAGLFTDRPVVTYDPRGTARNPTGTDRGPAAAARRGPAPGDLGAGRRGRSTAWARAGAR